MSAIIQKVLNRNETHRFPRVCNSTSCIRQEIHQGLRSGIISPVDSVNRVGNEDPLMTNG